jgi:hypothetical protein
MSENQPPAEEYTLVTDKGYLMIRNSDSETLKASRGFSGSGTATYQNGDKYTGEFINGVPYPIQIL